MSIEKRIILYLREEIEREKLATLSKFKTEINMSYRDLKNFLNSDDFLRRNYKDSVDRLEIPEISKASLRIINKDQDSLSEMDFDWMKKIVKSIDNLKKSDNPDKEFYLKSLGYDVAKR